MGSHRLSIVVCLASSDPALWLHLPGHNATVPSSLTAWQLHASGLLNNFTQILFPRVLNVAHVKAELCRNLLRYNYEHLMHHISILKGSARCYTKSPTAHDKIAGLISYAE